MHRESLSSVWEAAEATAPSGWGTEVTPWTETHLASGMHLSQEIWNIQFKKSRKVSRQQRKNHSKLSGKRWEMQIHHRDAPAARQTLERSVQPGDENVALRNSIHYGQHKGHEGELAVSELNQP